MNDTIVLYLQTPINEVDARSGASGNIAGTGSEGPGGFYGAYDYRVWDGTGYGQILQREANPGGKGYSVDVLDCGQHISVTAHYQSPATGKKISQSFIVVLKSPKSGNGTIFMTSTKWRTVSSVQQAASYIRSSIKTLANLANQH